MTGSKAEKLRLGLAALALAVLPSWLGRHLANLMGHRIARGAKIGFSWNSSSRLWLASGARIGHFNLIQNRRLLLREDAHIGHFNVIRGPISVALAAQASIGNRNVIARARRGVTYGPALLRLDEASRITAGHKIDCTNSVAIGRFSILAGTGTQLRTHGYVHARKGPGRYRIDGRVTIGDNVYVGARAMITAGVNIASGAMIGAGATVSKNLDQPALYVSGPLRRLPRPGDPRARSDLVLVEDPQLIETVYRKRRRGD